MYGLIRQLLNVAGFFLVISFLWFGYFAGVMWLSDIFGWNGDRIMFVSLAIMVVILLIGQIRAGLN